MAIPYPTNPCPHEVPAKIRAQCVWHQSHCDPLHAHVLDAFCPPTCCCDLLPVLCGARKTGPQEIDKPSVAILATSYISADALTTMPKKGFGKCWPQTGCSRNVPINVLWALHLCRSNKEARSPKHFFGTFLSTPLTLGPSWGDKRALFKRALCSLPNFWP